MSTVTQGSLTVGVAELSREDAVKLKMIVGELEDALSQALPTYRHVLAQIHTIIRNDPAQRTLLEPEEVAVIVKAMAHSKNVLFEEKAKVTKTGKVKVPKGQTLGSLL